MSAPPAAVPRTRLLILAVAVFVMLAGIHLVLRLLVGESFADSLLPSVIFAVLMSALMVPFWVWLLRRAARARR